MQKEPSEDTHKGSSERVLQQAHRNQHDSGSRKRGQRKGRDDALRQQRGSSTRHNGPEGRAEPGPSASQPSALSQSPSAAATPARPDKFKGTNANHLLRFQSSVTSATSQGGRQGAHARPRRSFIQPRPQKFDRNKFLQANYRFVVSDAVDASLHHADADRMFEWEDVLQVELLSSTPLSCPISLDNPPRCPQITPCGHIFSFPAIMAHLLHAGGPQLRRSAPCPLCFAPLISRDLRLVSTTTVIPPRVGQHMVFQLLKRGRTTIVPTIMGDPARTLDSAPHTQPALADAAADAGAAGSVGPEASGVTGSGSTAKPTVSSGTQPSAGNPLLAGMPTGQLGPLAANCFAKFATVGLSGAGALWETAARDLAAYAAEVMAWGGDDAAVEAPSVYAALDVLAVRARKWAEHRAELLLLGPKGTWVPGHDPPVKAATAGGSPDGSSTGLSPEHQGAYAEAQVKKMFVGAVDERALAASLAEAEVRQEEEQRAREALFPTLPIAPPRQQAQQQQQQQQQQLLQQRNGGTSTAASGKLSAAAASFSPPPVTRFATRTQTQQPQQHQHQQQQSQRSQQSQQQQQQQQQQSKGAGRGGSRGLLDSTFMAAFSDDEEQTDSEEEGEEGGEESGEGRAFAAHVPAAPAAQGTREAHEAGAGVGGAHVSSASQRAPNARLSSTVSVEGSAQLPASRAAEAMSAAAEAPAMSAKDMQVNSSTSSGDFYMYQAGDGQWVFMDPLNLKCLLHHFGTYDSCPSKITARILEVESIEQTEATRRRWRFLSHLPLSSTFLVAEVALSTNEGGPLPPSALTPFAEELGLREKRRRRRMESERKAAADSAAAAKAARNARQGPSSAELAAMPTLASAAAGEAQPPNGSNASSNGGTTLPNGALGQQLQQQQGSLAREEALAAARALGFASADDLVASVALQASLDEKRDVPHPPPGSSPLLGAGPPSFAQLARMGFAATGPALGSSPPSSGTAMQAQAAGAWASKSSALRSGGNSSTRVPSNAPAAFPQASRTPGLGPSAFPAPSSLPSNSSSAGLSSGPWGAGPIATSASPQAQPPVLSWGGGSSFRSVSSQPPPAPTPATPSAGSGAKKGNKKGQVLLSTTTQRKY